MEIRGLREEEPHKVPARLAVHLDHCAGVLGARGQGWVHLELRTWTPSTAETELPRFGGSKYSVLKAFGIGFPLKIRIWRRCLVQHDSTKRTVWSTMGIYAGPYIVELQDCRVRGYVLIPNYI